MKIDARFEKILFCVSSSCSAFLFFCFLGKAYGQGNNAPSWFDLIFGWERVQEVEAGQLKPIISSQSPLGILLFSVNLLLVAFGLWLFASCLLRKSTSLLIRGFALAHLFLLLVCIVLVSVCPAVFSSKELGSGSISYLVLSSVFALLDLIGLILCYGRRRESNGFRK